MVCVSTLARNVCAEVGMLFRGIWALRRRCCTGPLLLLGIAVGLFYHTVTMHRDRTEFKSSQRDQRNKSAVFDYKLLLKNPERLASLLEASQTDSFVRHSKRSCVGKAIILTGQHAPTDTEVQLYQRVLQQQGYRVDQACYAETSASLRQDRRDGRDWSVLICLKGSEKSCLRKINVAHPQHRQRVNIIPAFAGAFLDMGGVCRFLTDSQLSGVTLPILPSACAFSTSPQEGTPNAAEDEWRQPITHSRSDNQDLNATVNVYVLVTSATPLTAFVHRTVLVKTHLDKTSYATELQVFFRERLGPELSHQAVEHMNHVISDILKAALLTTKESFTLKLLFNFTLLFKVPFAFSKGYLILDDPKSPEASDPLSRKGRCVDPHLRQLYTDPPLVLMPAFNTLEKQYRAEVPFDVITVRIRPEPVSPHCHIHLDEHLGPRMANYPVGLGNSRINILVMDESEAEPVVMTIYTLHIYRDSRPSLPMFDEYVMCSFVQDCGLVVRPDQPCGLEPIPGTRSSEEAQASPRPCLSGDEPGRWVVPCLSCSDNRTCDWREVAWQPDSCYYPLLDQPQLQTCMMDRKVLFIGDSTNRGMMYYLMERVNTTLEDWDKAHDTIVYHNLNQGRTIVSYSYYPQFWLPKAQRPTFQRALQQLLERSQPLQNSPQTVLVAGGVQWLNLNHLRTIQQVLEREGLEKIVVVVKSLGMGFHLPVDGIRSLLLNGVQELYNVNKNILESAKHLGYEVIDTLSVTMGRYKEFLQGQCACHFHECSEETSS
ncbi:cadherin-like and PC-esterase domain-containing protein 1 [Sinocyclocheilus grahami]|uniref:cadherin-like and PC-esterase domain-containing protein 1 n=1 Tax=Sinocyclocheilus grahami TaxID=75366 RepID=UPI0007AD04A1|nr:PREDICTED: cadherin-like and PC-esterase domain-containing protein 1 [Sinocyclocheilus grahami]